jgi:hypothetical protein
MKISAVRGYPVKIGHRNQFVVVVETDEGIVGIGDHPIEPCEAPHWRRRDGSYANWKRRITSPYSARP